MSLLELENIVTAYGKVEVLKGLTLRVEQGEIVALLGSNGAAKSTTLRTISGLIRPRSGTMRFLGQPIDRLSPEAIVKLGVAHVPERRRGTRRVSRRPENGKVRGDWSAWPKPGDCPFLMLSRVR